MRRGFKTRAETLSEEARQALGLGQVDRLDPWVYAASLDVAVVDADQLDLAEHHARQLFEIDPESWSGLTLSHDDRAMVVLNSSHAPSRKCSTLMHELSHIRLGHVPANVHLSSTGMLLLSDYSDEQEDEADWLMGALLLPRQALITLRGRGHGKDEIASMFGVSSELCTWRLRMTGVEVQLRRRTF